jgi:hypothetical protein
VVVAAVALRVVMADSKLPVFTERTSKTRKGEPGREVSDEALDVSVLEAPTRFDRASRYGPSRATLRVMALSPVKNRE